MAQKFMWPLFCVVLALLVAHELDAMVRHEWRLLPLLSDMPDELGRYWFILLHIPMFGVLFWLTGHPAYEFQPPVETITVFGAAWLAAVHALFLFRFRAIGPRRR